MTGAISINAHGGFRSELLAQHAFSAWGTVVATPNSQDHGIDLFCNRIEKMGKRAWARAPFTVQVKSNMRPWKFEGKESVRWLVEHPLPLFLCVVDKAAKIRVYHTTPRFRLFGEAWEKVLLKPTKDAKGEWFKWKKGDNRCSLGAPILDFHFSELADEACRQELEATLDAWIEIENKNLLCLHMNIMKFEMPVEYIPNEPPTNCPSVQYKLLDEKASDETFNNARMSFRESLIFFGSELHKREEPIGATLALMLYEQVFGHSGFTHKKQIDEALSLPTDPSWVKFANVGTGFAGVGKIQKLFYEAITECLKEKEALEASQSLPPSNS